ncbi:leucine-rich repeat neuronal protein 1 [Episyrphus balteatus]|uniref:leucine-rich repeat neuronal protein 1 n=1 Tax=Episyrphus balteatus TaxID=286459 RepID=UPI002485904B|nr:leucine-rich repeat neuronal protein 1 [Episyrphus balteatus]
MIRLYLLTILFIISVSVNFAEEDVLLASLCHPTEYRSRNTCDCSSENESPWGVPAVKIDCSFKNLKSKDFPGDVLPLYSNTLDISWNTLEYVPSFESDSLKILNAMHNNILELVENNFQHLTMLQELYVSWNAIQTISSNAFEDLKYLQVLDLSHNNVKQIGFNVFGFLPSLNKLDMSWNRQLNNSSDLQAADFYLQFGVCLKLATLKLDKCGLKEINLPEKALLTSLSLRDNELERIPSVLPLTLKELDFSGNPLSSLSESHTKKLTGLEILFFEDMPSLTTVEMNSLTHLTKLRALSFQNCRHLSSFHEFAFGEQPTNRSLEVLSFRGSALRSFNETLLPVFQQLKEIDLNGMPLKCDCDMVWIKELKVDTNGRCITPSRLRGVKLTKVQKKDFSCDRWPKWVYACLILLTLILCTAGISLVVIGLRPKSNRVSMRRKIGSNSPYARVTIEPNRQDNSYY